ncbi:MAG: LPS export ABC transporter periplasmic protein LptC [Cytophagales bacterium]|nr:LPS export ABC transporter periplasmic protein LptC [Cytophagales bacterium]
MLKYLLLITWLLLPAASWAQKKDRIQFEAELLKNVKRDGERFKLLYENVVFRQKSTTIYCDSSYYYDKRGELEAFGRVKVYQGDSVTVDSEKLNYNGNTKTAQFRQKVVYQEGTKMTLYTDNLDYNMRDGSAMYYDGGKLVDAENTLTSRKGYYASGGIFMSFKNDVVLVSPDYTLYADTLVYNSLTKVAKTFGPTKIIKADGSVLESDGGVFNTRTNQSTFQEGTVESDSYIMVGDELYFDDRVKYYQAERQVELISTEDSLIAYGDFGFYNKGQRFSKMFENALLEKLLDEDTFFLQADTLVFLDDSLRANRKMLAYNHVRFVKGDISGIADSLVYYFGDSIITLYQDPVLWNGKSQIVGDTIHIIMADGKIDRMETTSNSFMVSRDTVGNFNQVKGRQMTAYFRQSNIDKIDVYGNGECIYFALDDEDNTVSGMNRILCSNISIFF